MATGVEIMDCGLMTTEVGVVDCKGMVTEVDVVSCGRIARVDMADCWQMIVGEHVINFGFVMVGAFVAMMADCGCCTEEFLADSGETTARHLLG